MRNWILRDHSDDTLLEAIERNVIEQKIYFASRHPQMDVFVEEDYILVDTHTESHLHNCIFTTKFMPESIGTKIGKTLQYFKDNNRPFSWMVGPTTPEEELSEVLREFGLQRIDKTYCMLINLSHFRKRPRYIRGFHVQQVLSKKNLRDFQTVIDEYHNVSTITDEYFNKIGSLNFHVSDPIRLFVGYLKEKPAIVGEVYLGAGIAGLSTYVAKDFVNQSRDLIVDLTAKMLSQAKHHGYHYAIVKSPKSNLYFYNQLGFRKYCQFYFYQ